MRLAARFHSSRSAISSLYGAFAVVLVSSVVVGVVLASAPARSTFDGRDGQIADDFLDAMATSTMDNSTVTVARAIGALCVAGPCHAREVTLAELRANLSRLAYPLAKAMGRTFELSLENASAPLLVIGDLPPRESATAARAEVYHGPSATYLTVTVRLGAH